jgi:hypothetical protein
VDEPGDACGEALQEALACGRRQAAEADGGVGRGVGEEAAAGAAVAHGEERAGGGGAAGGGVVLVGVDGPQGVADLLRRRKQERGRDEGGEMWGSGGKAENGSKGGGGKEA